MAAVGPSAGLDAPVSGDAPSNHGAATTSTAAAPALTAAMATDSHALYAFRQAPEHSSEHFPKHFDSWSEFEAYLSEFCAATYQPFRKRSSVGVAQRNRLLAENNSSSRPLPEEYRFYSVRYQCTHGRGQLSRGEGLRVRSALRSTGCMARLNATLKLDDRTQRYRIEAKLADAHNHPIGKEHYAGYTENRKITDPALLRVIETMKARGETGKAILARIREIMLETTGEKCLLTTKDIHNTVARLRKAKQTGGSQVGEEQDDQSAEDGESDFDSDSGEGSGNPSKRRRVDAALSGAAGGGATAIAETDFVFQTKKPNAGAKVKLSHLGVLLDASYCYNHIHNEITQVGSVTLELLPGTLSGFRHEILQLSPPEKPDDVDFVLPQYVISGCETEIVKYCHAQKVEAPQVSVRLEVTESGSDETRTVTLSSRQLLTMKRFYLARQNVAVAKRAIEWVTSSANLESCHAPAMFDEYADYSKDLTMLSLGLLPFSSIIVGGISLAARNLPMRFTDTIIGSSLLKFAGVDSNIDLDCAKAALLSLHSRFYKTASFVSPGFMLERMPADRCKQGSSYGAFLSPKLFVCGLVQLRSSRWAGFVLNCSKNVCCLYTSFEGEYEELQQVLGDLFVGYRLSGVDFEVLPPSSRSSTVSLAGKNDSGILSLLFVELMVQGKTWSDLGAIESLDYFRMRYLLQSAQVVTKQNVHEIRWS